MHMLIMLMNTQSKYRYSTQKVRVVVVLSSWELWLQSEQRRGMWMSEVKEDDLTSPDRCWRERSQYNWMWDNEPKLSVYETTAARSCFHIWSPDNQELPFYMQQSSRLSLSVAEDSSVITVFALTSTLRISTVHQIQNAHTVYLKLMFKSMWPNIKHIFFGF